MLCLFSVYIIAQLNQPVPPFPLLIGVNRH
jgi:hypothetical protein